MVTSTYLSDILTLLTEEDSEDCLLAQKQIEFITEETIEYTDGGAFVGFSHYKEIESYKVTNPNLILCGLIIKTTEFPIEAEAILHFEEGIIDYLEVWCYIGNYPHQELTTYTLTQAWEGSKNKVLQSL